MLLRSSYHELPARRRLKTYPSQPLMGEGWDGGDIMAFYYSKRYYSFNSLISFFRALLCNSVASSFLSVPIRVSSVANIFSC